MLRNVENRVFLGPKSTFTSFSLNLAIRFFKTVPDKGMEKWTVLSF